MTPNVSNNQETGMISFTQGQFQDFVKELGQRNDSRILELASAITDAKVKEVRGTFQEETQKLVDDQKKENTFLRQELKDTKNDLRTTKLTNNFLTGQMDTLQKTNHGLLNRISVQDEKITCLQQWKDAKQAADDAAAEATRIAQETAVEAARVAQESAEASEVARLATEVARTVSQDPNSPPVVVEASWSRARRATEEANIARERMSAAELASEAARDRAIDKKRTVAKFKSAMAVTAAVFGAAGSAGGFVTGLALMPFFPPAGAAIFATSAATAAPAMIGVVAAARYHQLTCRYLEKHPLATEATFANVKEEEKIEDRAIEKLRKEPRYDKNGFLKNPYEPHYPDLLF